MNKNSMKRATAAVCVGALLAVAQPAYAGDGNSLDRARVNQKVKFLEEVIDEYYLFDSDAQQMEEGIYTGLLYGLGDVYSEYYTPEEYARLMEQTQANTAASVRRSSRICRPARSRSPMSTPMGLLI